LYVQHAFHTLFALDSNIRVTSLKMLQLHITQHTTATTATATTTTTTTTQRSDSSLTQSQPFYLPGL
jgi:hypothetical protein